MIGISIGIETLIILGVPLVIISMLVSFIIRKKNSKQINVMRDFMVFLLSIYIILLVGVTLFPIYIIWGEPRYDMHIAINYMPFRSILQDISNIGSGVFSIGFQIKLLIRNVGGNIILLLPLGVLAPILWEKYRELRSCLLLGVVTSLSIECIQLLEGIFRLGRRTVDIDDLILNVLGVIIGFVMFKVFHFILKKYQIKAFTESLTL